MGNKVWAAFAAGALLVGAGFVTSIVSAPATASAQESEPTEDEGFIPRAFSFLEEVLDELVGDGEITQDQADTISEAVEDKAAEIKEELEEVRELLKGLLDDGVLTQDEASQLPDDHWVFGDAFDEAWEDGELTTEELREARPHPRRDFFKRGFRLGALADDGGIDQQEYDSLPDDHPLKQADVSEYLEDGVITIDELREILRDFQGERPGRLGQNA